jgi:hypothetical protein
VCCFVLLNREWGDPFPGLFQPIDGGLYFVSPARDRQVRGFIFLFFVTTGKVLVDVRRASAQELKDKRLVADGRRGIDGTTAGDASPPGCSQSFMGFSFRL